MRVVWLASYPRSGNTWLRFLLYRYTYGEIHSSSDVDRGIPPIQRATLNTSYDGTVLSKTHFLWSPEHPHADQTVGFIYLIRHPKDVLLSSFNYLRLVRNDPTTAQEFADEFISAQGVPLFGDIGYGSWPEHWHSWLGDQSLPHLVLRYEHLLSDTRACLEQALRFLEADLDDERMSAAIESCSFAELQAMERAEKVRSAPSSLFPGTCEQSRDGVMFMHRGQVTHSLAHMSPELDRRFDQELGPALDHWGYR